MFDFHTHIIPGIDDGAADEETASAMMEIAVRHGTTGLIVTPHVVEGDWLPSWERILDGCELLRRLAREAGLKLQIYPGAEVALNMDILERLAGPGPYCINGGSYMLVELPALEIPSYTEDFFFKLQARGIIPVLAHPERNRELMNHPERIRQWIERGILAQLNAPSLMGRMGAEVKAAAELMLSNGMAHFIGSDAHGIHSRRPILSGAAEKIEVMMGKETLDRLCRDYPSRAVRDEVFEVQPVQRVRPLKKEGAIKKWINLFFGRNG